MSVPTTSARSLSSWLRRTVNDNVSPDHRAECSRAMEQFQAMEDHLAAGHPGHPAADPAVPAEG